MKDKYEFSARELEIIKKRTSLLSQEVQDFKKNAKVVQIVHFSLADEWYGLRIDHIRSIIRAGKIAPLPFTPDFLIGIINVRGKIISVVDLRRFLSLGAAKITDKSRMILVQLNHIETAFLVEDILEIKEVRLDEIESPLVTLERKQSQYILGEFKLNNNFIAVLNLPAILESDKMQILNN